MFEIDDSLGISRSRPQVQEIPAKGSSSLDALCLQKLLHKFSDLVRQDFRLGDGYEKPNQVPSPAHQYSTFKAHEHRLSMRTDLEFSSAPLLCSDYIPATKPIVHLLSLTCLLLVRTER